MMLGKAETMGDRIDAVVFILEPAVIKAEGLTNY